MTCQKRTTKYAITPNPSGVHFSGFEHVSFESRRGVEDQLRAFISRLQTIDNPMVRIIVGDWGDGKSELYERYLRPHEEKMKYTLLYCVASQIQNAMHSSRCQTCIVR